MPAVVAAFAVLGALVVGFVLGFWVVVYVVREKGIIFHENRPVHVCRDAGTGLVHVQVGHVGAQFPQQTAEALSVELNRVACGVSDESAHFVRASVLALRRHLSRPCMEDCSTDRNVCERACGVLGLDPSPLEEGTGGRRG